MTRDGADGAPGSDEALWDAAMAGAEAARDALARRFGAPVRAGVARGARSLLKTALPAQDLEDAVQDFWADAWSPRGCLARWRPDGGVPLGPCLSQRAGWWGMMVGRKRLTQSGRHRLIAAIEERPDTRDDGPLAALLRAEDKARVVAWMATLSEADWELVESWMAGLSISEIARMRGEPRETVRDGFQRLVETARSFLDGR